MPDRLERAYERVFGSKTSKGQLYTGFYLLLIGIALGAAGFVLYNLGTDKGDTANSYQWREAGLVLGSLAAPAVFLGIFWALPSKVSMRWLAGIGTLLCLGGTAFLSFAYPLHFNVAGSPQQDYTFAILSLFALGLVLILGGTFTSLIGYYLSRITGAAATPTSRAGGELDISGAQFQYDVPDSVIERDIELAMKRYKYTWGSEGASTSQTGIQINVPDEFEKGVTIGGRGVARSVQLETPQVEEATKRLRGMRPSVEKSVPSEWAEDSTKALLEFRKKKETLGTTRGTQPRTGQTEGPGAWGRFTRWIGRLFGRKPTPPLAREKHK